MAKSRIGPFALEAPLSKPKPTGQVFRGIHLEQKKLAALRIFSVPMGLTPESRQAYATQLEELKQLRHPGIVRCYGGGFDARNAYLAYELVDGEPLDDLIARRDRLSWETALEYSQQLTSALEHAHQAGWIHGRLKPDKVLISQDGVAKISDWRREEVASMIDAGKPSHKQLQFSAPEVLAGEDPDEKSDLYSVGVLMFLMLTGQAPFDARSDQLPALVQETPAPKVSAMVMDCPVWLSAIVEQLLSKDPKNRPFSATALQLAFKEAQRRQAEGVGVLQHATAGFSPLQMNVDRDEAEKVLGIKPKKKKRKRQDDTPLTENVWVLSAAFVATLAAVVWFLLPLSQATLRARAEKRLPPSSEEWSDWNDARDKFLLQLVDRFPEGEHADWAGEQIAWVTARERERRLKRDHRLNRRTDWSDADRQYWQAWEYEEFGDLFTALEKYQALVGLYREEEQAASIVYLAEEAIARINTQGLTTTQLQEFVILKLESADKAYEQAKIREAKRIWEWIVTLYENNPELTEQVAEAKSRLAEQDDLPK